MPLLDIQNGGHGETRVNTLIDPKRARDVLVEEIIGRKGTDYFKELMATEICQRLGFEQATGMSFEEFIFSSPFSSSEANGSGVNIPLTLNEIYEGNNDFLIPLYDAFLQSANVAAKKFISQRIEKSYEENRDRFQNERHVLHSVEVAFIVDHAETMVGTNGAFIPTFEDFCSLRCFINKYGIALPLKDFFRDRLLKAAYKKIVEKRARLVFVEKYIGISDAESKIEIIKDMVANADLTLIDVLLPENVAVHSKGGERVVEAVDKIKSYPLLKQEFGVDLPLIDLIGDLYDEDFVSMLQGAFILREFDEVFGDDHVRGLTKKLKELYKTMPADEFTKEKFLSLNLFTVLFSKEERSKLPMIFLEQFFSAEDINEMFKAISIHINRQTNSLPKSTYPVDFETMLPDSEDVKPSSLGAQPVSAGSPFQPKSSSSNDALSNGHGDDSFGPKKEMKTNPAMMVPPVGAQHLYDPNTPILPEFSVEDLRAVTEAHLPLTEEEREFHEAVDIVSSELLDGASGSDSDLELLPLEEEFSDHLDAISVPTPAVQKGRTLPQTEAPSMSDLSALNESIPESVSAEFDGLDMEEDVEEDVRPQDSEVSIEEQSHPLESEALTEEPIVVSSAELPSVAGDLASALVEEGLIEEDEAASAQLVEVPVSEVTREQKAVISRWERLGQKVKFYAVNFLRFALPLSLLIVEPGFQDVAKQQQQKSRKADKREKSDLLSEKFKALAPRERVRPKVRITPTPVKRPSIARKASVITPPAKRRVAMDFSKRPKPFTIDKKSARTAKRRTRRSASAVKPGWERKYKYRSAKTYTGQLDSHRGAAKPHIRALVKRAEVMMFAEKKGMFFQYGAMIREAFSSNPAMFNSSMKDYWRLVRLFNRAKRGDKTLRRQYTSFLRSSGIRDPHNMDKGKAYRLALGNRHNRFSRLFTRIQNRLQKVKIAKVTVPAASPADNMRVNPGMQKAPAVSPVKTASLDADIFGPNQASQANLDAALASFEEGVREYEERQKLKSVNMEDKTNSLELAVANLEGAMSGYVDTLSEEAKNFGNPNENNPLDLLASDDDKQIDQFRERQMELGKKSGLATATVLNIAFSQFKNYDFEVNKGQVGLKNRQLNEKFEQIIADAHCLDSMDEIGMERLICQIKTLSTENDRPSMFAS